FRRHRAYSATPRQRSATGVWGNSFSLSFYADHGFDGMDDGQVDESIDRLPQSRVGVRVGGEHQFGVLDAVVVDIADRLAHELDGRALVGEDLGDRCQHAGTVDHVEGDVVAGRDRGDRQDAGVLVEG